MANEERRKQFQDVRDRNGRLICRCDTQRAIIQTKPSWSKSPIRVDAKSGKVVEDEGHG